jgi:hypothetical protein
MATHATTDKKVDKVEDKKVTVTKKESLIYCGGNFPGGKLASYTTFRDGIPSHIEGLIKDCPALKSLFVKTDDFPLMMQKINDKNSAEHQVFLQVEKFRLGVK